jgi:hypothetical protein
MAQLSSECINRNLLFDFQKGTIVPPVVGSRHCEMIFIGSVPDSIREAIPGSGEDSFLSYHQGVWFSIGFVCFSISLAITATLRFRTGSRAQSPDKSGVRPPLQIY